MMWLYTVALSAADHWTSITIYRWSAHKRFVILQ